MRRAAASCTGVIIAIVAFAGAGAASAQPPPRLDSTAAARATRAAGSSRVIISAADGAALPDVAATIARGGGTALRTLPIINAHVADVPNAALSALANAPGIARIALDRPIAGALERTGATIGAASVRADLGYDGSGVGVAVIDSGVTAWHDDLGGGGMAQRVARFVDFVNGRDTPYDDYGHGTHVAGIVAGNGADSSGARSGIAPNARLIVLKALDGQGRGRISDVIAALDYAVAHAAELNIRVINMSVASAVYDSYAADPLTRAAERAVASGLVVVAAAGNFGRDSQGRMMYGGITAPGNAPSVLTVGASSHMGTIDPGDDTIARFSSRGPTSVDLRAKPDIVAPGVGIESLSAPDSLFYTTYSKYLLAGIVPTPYLPYLSLSGTSMAAPVVAGTVALMLQANPTLTPNQVKAILEFTARADPRYDPLTEGAGFLNARGAVDLALYLASPATMAYPSADGWVRRIVWGNRLVAGGRFTSNANAWASDVTWGSATTPDAQPIVFGSLCAADRCSDSAAWTTSPSRNVVWGSRCGGDDCSGGWGIGLFGASDGDTVVWGTADNGDTVVWGTSDGDTVVWGTSDGDTVVWGTSCIDPSCAPVVWQQ